MVASLRRQLTLLTRPYSFLKKVRRRTKTICRAVYCYVGIKRFGSIKIFNHSISFYVMVNCLNSVKMTWNIFPCHLLTGSVGRITRSSAWIKLFVIEPKNFQNELSKMSRFSFLVSIIYWKSFYFKLHAFSIHNDLRSLSLPIYHACDSSFYIFNLMNADAWTELIRGKKQ